MAAQQPATFDEYLVQAQTLFKQDKLGEALAAVQAAARLQPARYEASALAALILHQAGKQAEAHQALADARKLAPAEMQSRLNAAAKFIESPVVGSADKVLSPSSVPVAETPDQRRRFDVLILIMEDADKAGDLVGRRKFLEEFMTKSAPYLVGFPGDGRVWTLRAMTAVELNRPKQGWEAGREMLKLGVANTDDSKIRKVLATLDRKGWLGDNQTDASDAPRAAYHKMPDVL